MPNESKITDPRMWRKWWASGAIKTGNADADAFRSLAARQTDPVLAGICLVEAGNDRTNWEPIPPPPLGKVRIFVSSAWTEEERRALEKILLDEDRALREQEDRDRQTIRWGAPCFQEYRIKRAQLLDLLVQLRTASSSFLELNRTNFSDYI